MANTQPLLSVTIVFHSQSGNTALLAEAIAQGVRQTERADAALYPVVGAEIPWAALAKADAIIFGCPTYMGSVSAAFKGFMDASIGAWFQGAWRDKIAAGFTNSANPSGDKLSTLQQLNIFAAQHGMIWVGLDGKADPSGKEDSINRLGSWVGAMGESDPRRPDGALPEADRRTAHYLGRRVALATHRWHFGRV
jgi:multimeric flavodoxin WrbA